MTTYIDIICLANSRKRNGHCIAGKMFDGNHLGEWMRPVSALPTGELSSEDISFENGKRLMQNLHLPEADLFSTKEELIELAYDLQGKRIAYVFRGVHKEIGKGK
jgi:hypothetical protein